MAACCVEAPLYELRIEVTSTGPVTRSVIATRCYTNGSAASRLVYLTIICSLPHLLGYRSSLLSDISRLIRRRFLFVGSIDCGAIARRYRCCNGNIGELAAITAAVAACRVVVDATSASQLPPPPPPLRPFRRSNSSQDTTSVSEDGWQFSVLALQRNIRCNCPD